MQLTNLSDSTLLQSVLMASQNGVFVCQAIRNADNVITDLRLSMLNAVAERDMKRPAINVLGQPFSRVFPHLVPTELPERYRQVLYTGQSDRFEFRYQMPGTTRPTWFDVSVVPMGDSIVISYNDISQARVATEAVRQLNVLQQAFDTSVNGISVFEAVHDSTGEVCDFRYVMINDTGLRLSGYSRSDVLGRTLRELFPETSHNGIFDHFKHVFETEEPFNGEQFYAEKDAWRQLNVMPVEQGVMVTDIDITELKKARSAYQEQARLLQTISDNTPVGLVLWEATRDDAAGQPVVDFRYRMANLMNTFVTGHPAETLVGNRFLELFPRFRGTELDVAMREVVQTGRTQRLLFTYYTERPEAWFDAQLLKVGDGVLMTFMDVTEQHKAQLDQKAQADLLKSVVNAQTACIALFDIVQTTHLNGQSGPAIDFRYVLANKATEQLLNRPTRDIIGQTTSALFTSPEALDFQARMREVAETGITQEFIHPFYADGLQGWFQATMIRQGNQLLLTYLDVTTLKQQQQTLELMNLNLSRSNDNLQQFAYVASHDLQEPLRKIQLFGTLLTKQFGSSLPADAQQLLFRMSNAAKRMAALISDLLSYSQVSTHRSTPQSIRLGDLLNDVADDLAVALGESGATLDHHHLPTLIADRGQLQQLFQSLLSNAIKFRRPDAPPHIQIRHRQCALKDLPEATIALLSTVVQLDQTRSYHEISVTDNGIGFDEKYLDRIFQVFQRLHTKGEYSGTGVGLAICQKVANNHRGVLTATSQPGQGATFLLYLPVE